MGSDADAGWLVDNRVVRALRPDPAATIDTTRWPATVPAVEQILAEGLELAPGLTILVGENGSGKSTLTEILARAGGLKGSPRCAALWSAVSGWPPPMVLVPR